MDSYKLMDASPPVFSAGVPTTAIRSSDGANIPLHQGNRDCVKFLADWKAGATVTNVDGSPAPYSDAAVTALGMYPNAPNV